MPRQRVFMRRTELLALDAAEAYIDITRYTRLIAIGEDNVRVHRDLLATCNPASTAAARAKAILSKRVNASKTPIATLAGFRQSLDEARAKYRKSVGLEPYNLRNPGPP